MKNYSTTNIPPAENCKDSAAKADDYRSMRWQLDFVVMLDLCNLCHPVIPS